MKLSAFISPLLCLVVPAILHAQTREIKGRVYDLGTGNPLTGVYIIDADKVASQGVFTNEQGEFSIITASRSDIVLRFSLFNYKTLDYSVGNRATLQIDLERVYTELEKSVIIGYGTVKKGNLTGAIVSSTLMDLTSLPATHILENLQGRLPGVDILRNSGAAGSGVSVRVRGNRSLSASNEPLYIVDGIQFSHIEDLNPYDIASVEVLKDAASAAIYGSRGANGVFIITTHQGVKDETHVTFQSYAGQTGVTALPTLQNGSEYIALRRAANAAVGLWKSPEDDEAIFGTLPGNQDTRWTDEILQHGSLQAYHSAITSGSDRTRLYSSLDYFRESGTLKNDVFRRYSARINLDHSLSRLFSIGTRNQFTYYNQDQRNDPLVTAAALSPLETPLDDQGNIVRLLNNNRFVNPLMDEVEDNYVNNNKVSRIFTSAYLDFFPYKGLSFRSNLGVILTQARSGLYAGTFTTERSGEPSLSRYQSTQLRAYNLENILSYTHTLGDHALSYTTVHSILSNTAEQVSAQGSGQILSYQGFFALANANKDVSINSRYEESALISLTGRVQYNYKDKYLLTLTGRTDAASQLSPGNKWAFFPSISAAWRITEEPFMQKGLFSDLKIRAGFGSAGNSAVQPYSTQSSLSRTPYAFGESPAIGYVFSNRIGNDGLGWEISQTLNLGLDLAVFSAKLTGNIDVFQTNSVDLLQERSLPLSTGVSSVIENIGKSQTRGLEIGLGAKPIQTDAFSWDIALNWFAVQEKIVKLAAGLNDERNNWFRDAAIQSYFDYEFIGIWQENEADEAKRFDAVPGDIKVKDQNNDGRIDPQNDRIVLGTDKPDWNAFLSQDIHFKRWDLNLQLFARWGQTLRYELYDIYDPQGVNNSLKHTYWTPERGGNDFPRPNANRPREATPYYSSLYYREGSFIKLRGLTLGYSLPSELFNKWGVASLRFYAVGKNLYTYSKIKHYDPERGGALSFPFTRLIAGGLELTF